MCTWVHLLGSCALAGGGGFQKHEEEDTLSPPGPVIYWGWHTPRSVGGG